MTLPLDGATAYFNRRLTRPKRELRWRLMDKYCYTVDAAGAQVTQPYTKDELAFLSGKTCPEIEAFVIAIGLWDNFRVATGMDAKAWTTKDRVDLLLAARSLQKRIEADWEFYSHDYWYGLPGSRSRSRGTLSVTLESGESGLIRARHPGHFYLSLTSAAGGTIDLRRGDSFIATNIGRIRVFRKKNNLRWPQFLDHLAVFLKGTDVEQVRIRHHYPASI